jgi:hypothetical protein
MTPALSYDTSVDGDTSVVPIICTTGATVVRAARLETSGRPNVAYVCEDNIAKLKEEGFDCKGVCPTHHKYVHKGLPDTPSFFFSCETGVFE